MDYARLGSKGKAKTVDHIMDDLSKYRLRLINLLKDGNDLIREFENGVDLLPRDDECVCSFGTNPHYDLRYRCYRCSSCDILEKLMDFDHPSRPFLIEFGLLAGKHLCIKPISTSRIDVHEDSTPKDVSRLITRDQCSIEKCEPLFRSIDRLKCIGLDPLLNQVCNSWILEEYLYAQDLRTVQKLYMGFGCGKTGFELVEAIEPITNLTNLDRETVTGIIIQLISTFNLLSEYQFTHGLLDQNMLGFTKEPVIVKEKKCSVTIKLCNLQQSSITYYGNRYFSPSQYSKCTVMARVTTPLVIPGDTYKLPRNSFKFLFACRHLGVPVFSSSLDLYATMIVLMCNSEFREIVRSDQFLTSIWNELWNSEDRSQINREITQLEPTESNMICFLSNFSFKCDAIKRLWILIN